MVQLHSLCCAKLPTIYISAVLTYDFRRKLYLYIVIYFILSYCSLFAQEVSSIEHGGMSTVFYMVDQYFGNLMEVPTTRLPNEKMLLRWPSRMHILEQFGGTIKWKVTERSKGASPQRLSEARERPSSD